jgi:hypothetical protein
LIGYAAWDLGEELGVEVASVVPAFLLGPPCVLRPSANIDYMRGWLEGRPTYESRLIADVR